MQPFVGQGVKVLCPGGGSGKGKHQQVGVLTPVGTEECMQGEGLSPGE